jgi:hypothetical protein
MTTLTKTYPTELAARRAVEALRATGVPERDTKPAVCRCSIEARSPSSWTRRSSRWGDF